MPPASRAKTLLEAAAVTLALLSVYASGASPTIFVGDSGELVAAVGTLGIPHPSGYPLYVMLGKLWTLLLPIGSIAYRMSLFSAATAALACGSLYALARMQLRLDRPAALLAAALLAFSPSFWAEANIQRVYALNALLLVLATAAALAWMPPPPRGRSTRKLALAFFLCGLGATNHTFMAVAAVMLGLSVALADPGLVLTPARLARALGAAFGAFALGLLPYAYLPIRSRMDPRLDWGNPESFGAMADVVLRRDFWERAWIESPADLIAIASDYLLGIGVETLWLGALLAAFGALSARRYGVRASFMLLVMAGNFATLAFHGSRSDIFIWHRYYIPSYVMVALLAGVGWQTLGARMPAPARWGALVVPMLLFTSHYAETDRSRFRVAEDFAYAVLESLPPGANLIATDDNVLFVLIYLHLVEGRRPDVNLILQGVGKADLPPLRFDPVENPLFFTHHPNWDLPELEVAPIGVVYRAWRRGQPLPEVVMPRTELDGEHDSRVPKDYLTQNLIGHFHYTVGFTYENRDWLRARAAFARAAVESPQNDVLFYNLGLVYARNGLYEEAANAFTRSYAINPRHLASTSKADAADKLVELRAESSRIAGVEAGIRDSHPELQANADGDFHQRMGELLAEAGEPVAARGRRLRALESRAP